MLADPIGMKRLGKASQADRSMVKHPRLQALHDYWLAERGTRKLPTKRSFDFNNLKTWLGHIALVEVARDPVQFRFRLYGTYLADLAGADYTGKSLDQCFPADKVEAALAPYCRCVAFMSPVFISERFRALNGAIGVIEHLLLPCSSDDRVVDVIVGALYLDTERN